MEPNQPLPIRTGRFLHWSEVSFDEAGFSIQSPEGNESWIWAEIRAVFLNYQIGTQYNPPRFTLLLKGPSGKTARFWCQPTLDPGSAQAYTLWVRLLHTQIPRLNPACQFFTGESGKSTFVLGLSALIFLFSLAATLILIAAVLKGNWGFALLLEAATLGAGWFFISLFLKLARPTPYLPGQLPANRLPPPSPQ